MFTFVRCSLTQIAVTSDYICALLRLAISLHRAGLELLQEVSYLNLEKYEEERQYKGCSRDINTKTLRHASPDIV